MKVNLDTKLHVNSFMMDKFSSKGNVGYLYFKLFVEIYYEKYKELGYIPNYRISELIKLAKLRVSPETCRKSLNYFFKSENLSENLQDTLITITEQVIQAYMVPPINDKIEGDEF